MSTYSVLPFALQSSEKTSVPSVYTTTGVVRLSNIGMVGVIKALEKISGAISEEELDALLVTHDVKTDIGRTFLERIRIVQPCRRDIAVALYSKDKDSIKSLLSHIKANDAVEVYETNDPSTISKPTLLVALQPAYCPEFALEITKIAQNNKNCLLLHAYFIVRHFIIDGLFSYEMGLPDHFSAIDRLTSLEQSYDFKPSCWSELFYNTLSPFKTDVPTLPMTPLEKNAALYGLFTRLRSLISYGSPPLFPNDISSIIELNLDTGIVQKYRGAHSPDGLSARGSMPFQEPTPMSSSKVLESSL